MLCYLSYPPPLSQCFPLVCVQTALPPPSFTSSSSAELTASLRCCCAFLALPPASLKSQSLPTTVITLWIRSILFFFVAVFCCYLFLFFMEGHSLGTFRDKQAGARRNIIPVHLDWSHNNLQVRWFVPKWLMVAMWGFIIWCNRFYFV